jgi:hypothetical protein
MSHRSALVAFACLAGATAQSQENKPQDFAAARALLQRMIDRMSALPACTFTVQQEQVRSNVAGAGGIALGGGGLGAGAPAAPAPAAGRAVVAVAATSVAAVPNPVAGGWGDGLLWASANEGRDLAVWHGRRAIARQDQQAWKPRQGVLGDGLPLPRPLDPDTFFLALQHGKLELIHSEVGSLDDRPTQIVTGHAAGDDAYDLLWSGLLPDGATNSSLGGRAANLARLGRAKPDIDLDVAIWIDPATARAQQIKIRCYTRLLTAAQGALVAPALAGGPPGAALPPRPPAKGDAEAKKEDAAKEEPERLTFADGLPVRTPKDQVPAMVVRYDVVFGNPGAAPALDDAARAMLGLPAAK